MSETPLLKKIMVQWSELGHRIFRNNVGTGWVGKSTRLSNGDMLIKFPRPLRAGLCLGSSDLIGYTKIEINSSHVGKTLAVFTAIEIKANGTRTTIEQKNFINHLVDSGAVAFVITDKDEGTKEWIQKKIQSFFT